MAVFNRREVLPAVPGKASYTKYRPYVREDFCECCAYCLLHEIIAAGQDNFELDHFRPKSNPLFASLVNDFYNIYYSCHVCNHYKGNSWPEPDLEDAGYSFVDLCKEKFSTHFKEEPNGHWLPLTRAGEYTEAKLRLNREHLVEIRGLLREIAQLRGEEPIDWDSPCRNRIKELIGTPSSTL
jgi:hypothetical protein